MALAKSVATRLTRRTMRPNHRAVPADSTTSAWGAIALPARHETGRRFARLTQAAIAAALWFATCVVYAGCRTDKDFLPAAATLVHRAEVRSPAESDMLVRIEQGFGREVIGEILRRHSTGGPTDAETMAVHRGSSRVMEKAGMRHVRSFHAEWPVRIPGDEHGDVEYAITRSEWEADRSSQAR